MIGAGTVAAGDEELEKGRKGMGGKRGYGAVRVGIGRKLAPSDKRKVAATKASRRRRQERPQQEQPWGARPRRPGGS